jgi:thymidine phosphorylase
MDASAIIGKIRRKQHPTEAELQWFTAGLASGAVSSAQAGAFAMAVCLNGLGNAGRVALTTGMRDSGDILKWDLSGPVLDKHSTGGIGDCVSLILAPALAACGAYVPMISGRGLGHTGGTLDKLEAIPGVSTQITEARLRKIVGKTGCAIVGATGRIAPADKVLYGIRDVTSTVDSIDLITASILSKKLAAGLDGLVLDVKTGSGAFMKTEEEAKALAASLVETANGAGCKTTALITDMNSPLAPALGNAVEVAVCMEVLSGNTQAAQRLHDLVVALGANLLAMHGESTADAASKMTRAIASGDAMTRFAEMIAAMGGPPDMADDWRTHLPKAPVVGEVLATADGYVSQIDGQALGVAVVGLGGGRRVESDKIDPAVGLTDVVGLGAKITKGQPVCTLHARTEDTAEVAAKAILSAISIGPKPAAIPLILQEIT